ncbi:MAG: amidohydrolase [bacterium]|nr:amidohydrolase [bacterium]
MKSPIAALGFRLAAFAPLALPALAQSPFEKSDRWIDEHADRLRAINRSIWSNPELGLEEHLASDTLVRFLEQNGFRVTRGSAGMPTAFIAEAGSGSPVIGILAEYDALPGVSQKPTSKREARDDNNDAGHACGHSVFGTASAGAAAAAAAIAKELGTEGTIRLYGTPAEETGIGKVFMARAGLFDDLDACLHWHPSDTSRTSFATSKAVVSVKFRFHGQSAHASFSPQHGRSALDAVELMNIGVNFLREHLEDHSRVHYVITDGGGQPNVVPPTAEVWYYLRANSHAYAEHILERVREIARGAALMTRTEVKEQLDSDLFELLPNQPLSALLQTHLERVGPPRFDATEAAFARETQSELPAPPPDSLAQSILELPTDPFHIPASTDVGNVSWIVPTSGIGTACYTHGAPGHSWQVVACTGMSVGEKGMLVAARSLASATLELLEAADVRKAAKTDFERRRATQENPTSVLPKDAVAPVKIR